ncbi:MAG: hypothetical protein ACQGVC_07135 [Myxococcota bacterium]
MEETNARETRSPSFVFEIFAVSMAAILLEITYTRVFSFKVYYYFTYLILGVALLGLGSGGVLVATSRRLAAVPPERRVAGSALAAGASVLLGYFLIAPAPLDVSAFAERPVELLKLAGVMGLLALPFLCSGVTVATILSSRPERAARLYGADLLGAGLGCAAVVPLLHAVTPPGAVMLCAGLYALAALPARGRAVRGAAVGVAGVALLATLLHHRLPDPVTDAGKQFEAYREGGLLLHSAWNPVFRVDVARHPLRPDVYVLHHDGMPGSGIHRFDGDLSRQLRFLRDPRVLPFATIGQDRKVLIVGAAGGHEILASLFFEAREVTGVELNPVTVDLLRNRYADYAGRLHEDPRVRLVNAEARSFLAADDERYDLIWFVAPDSYAAMNASTSAAFVLSESYLYTVEMLEEALAHLAPDGVLCAQFGERSFATRPKRTARYLATARAAFERAGLGDFAGRVLVATSDGLPPWSESTVLLGRTPFSEGQVQGFREWTDRVSGGRVQYVPGGDDGSPILTTLVRGTPGEVGALRGRLPFQTGPVADDSPFFWHFTRFRDAARLPFLRGGFQGDWEEALGEQLMLALLGIVTVFAAVLLLLPLVTIRSVFRAMPHKALAGVYFAALGTGFMFVEVCLIQMLTLFLGYPTYSLSVTLFVLLVASGLGSLASERLLPARDASLLALGALLAVGVFAYPVLLPLLVERFVGGPLALRVAISVVAIAPLGLCLGAFLPLGLATVAAASPHPREYVAWAWAVNGFFSVMASIGSTILAMMFGFQVVLWIALAIYAAGIACLRRIPAPAAGPTG